MNNMCKKEVLCEREYGIIVCRSVIYEGRGMCQRGCTIFLLNEAPENLIERERKRNQDTTSVTKATVTMESNVSVYV